MSRMECEKRLESCQKSRPLALNRRKQEVRENRVLHYTLIISIGDVEKDELDFHWYCAPFDATVSIMLTCTVEVERLNRKTNRTCEPALDVLSSLMR